MGKYLGPKGKIVRREGTNIFGSEKFTRILTKRKYPPGVHGPKQASGFTKSRLSEYGVQLREKQKVKRTYGILEKQFKKYFKKAHTSKEETGYELHRLLEMRFDNIVYRLGFAKTRAQARQLINHYHFVINEKKVNIPSFQVKVGEEIALRKKSKELVLFQSMEENKERSSELPSWLTIDEKRMNGKVVAYPKADDLAGQFNFKLIIEFYSR